MLFAVTTLDIAQQNIKVVIVTVLVEHFKILPNCAFARTWTMANRL
jgi:hypothetical protein